MIDKLRDFKASETVGTGSHAIVRALLAIGVTFHTGSCVSEEETICACLAIVCQAKIRIAFGTSGGRGRIEGAVIAVLYA